MPNTRSVFFPAALIQRAGLTRRGSGQSKLGAEIETRLLALLVEQNLASLYATASVILMTGLIAPFLAHTVLVLWILLARTLALGVFQLCARLLHTQLANDAPTPRAIRHVILANGLSAFLWGAITWPLEIGSNLDFMSFLIITIALFSVCLSIVSAGLHRASLIATAIGGGLGLLPKIVLLTATVGYLLPLGFVVYMATITAYAVVISRQSRAGVLSQLRGQRLASRLAAANQAMQTALERANWLANRDALTELRNRRAFENELDGFITQFTHRAFCLMLLDIDHFKQINDRFGHETGDGVLMAIGTALRQWEREFTGRMTGRWGGEEFIALIALRKGERPSLAAEALRHRIEELGDQLHWPATVRLTTSIGCARLWSPAEFDKALVHADGALYAAKDSGRNCWRIAA